MFARKEELNKRPLEIDLTGPAGNAFAILGVAKSFAKQCGHNWDSIEADMTSGDYEHLLEVFDGLYGDFVVMYR